MTGKKPDAMDKILVVLEEALEAGGYVVAEVDTTLCEIEVSDRAGGSFLIAVELGS